MRSSFLLLPALVLALVLAPAPAAANTLECRLDFNMSGWSVFYKRSSGEGTVRCNNGQSLRVNIHTEGGGLSFGKSRIENGVGRFSGVRDIRDVLGGYATAEAHAGAVRSAKAQVVTKGPISLALSGTGHGWDLGVAFGSFIISTR
ncbi:hypothetical protein E2F46_08685 [Luteimonas aestuarii]|uniref:Secreted protein n=1 Tax=Luteimonas aestuarii TaxID=453837 RepID=A0A4R5TP18_9GAMM|nr:hypothetical protein [Luteimonas aestuarii]TDK24352.1 hypothetical protein E2F46_08685 [Luteimonas aestuarii]